MKRFLILIFVLISIIPASAQTKYFIYFKDKGASASETLKKSSSDVSIAYKYLSPRSIERRMKSSPASIMNYEDFPVNHDYINILKQNGIGIQNKLKWFNAVTAFLTDEELQYVKTLPFVTSIGKVRKIYYENPQIEKIEQGSHPGSLAKTAALDYGSSYAQYELSEIPVVHNAGINGSGVIIGILDSGFDWKQHESLNNANVLAEYDFVFHDSVTANEAEDSPTQHNHGTAVFSVIGGYKPGQIIGPAYGAQFVLAKTEDVRSETHAEEDNYAAALEWMDSIGVDITTASLGYSDGFTNGDDYEYSDMDGQTAIVTIAAEKAFERGITVINAAGNEGNKTWHYINAPSDGPNVIAVGAVNNDNILAAFSSRGPTYDGRIKPEITARGVYVYCASAGTVSSYGYSDGTSLATPIASGIAALLLSAKPTLTNVQIRDTLINSGDNFNNPNNNIGYGLVSARRALNLPYAPEQPSSEYSLTANYPNPFNSYTHINFISVTEDIAELYIYDMLGRRVRTLFKDKAQIGENKTVWNGKSDNGLQCASGIYYYALKIAGKEYAKKMILMK